MSKLNFMKTMRVPTSSFNKDNKRPQKDVTKYIIITEQLEQSVSP